MHSWTLVDTDPTQGRIFQRLLDPTEVWFFLLGHFNGAADGFQYCELRPLNGPQDARLFTEANIVKAWLSTKRRYPLTGATVRGGDGAPFRLKAATDLNVENGAGFASELHFVVRECDLAVLRQGEMVFGHVASAEEAQRRMTAIMYGPRPLSGELLMQLYVFRETDPQRTNALHLMILVAHCVTDRLAISTFTRCLLDTLARGEDSEPVQIPLEDRLAMSTPSMYHEPKHLRLLSPAIRRWRRAVGAVIYQSKMAKRQGGHTLPCRLTHLTSHIASRPGLVFTSLTQTQTATVIANCRLHGVTFGNAYLALAQVAMTRVLYRWYLRGDISEEEWAYRKRQPFFGGGPFNLRPHLDREWFEKGGGGEPMLSLGIFLYQLPFMTLGETAKQHEHVLSNGTPPFSDLLTFDRFLHRSELVKKQVTSFSNHPLFFEITRAAVLEQIEHTRLGVLQWMKRAEATDGQDTHSNSDEVLAVTDIPMVWAYAGSSAGNLDLMSPTEYPLPPTHPLSPYSSVAHPFKAGYVTPHSPPVSASAAQTTPKVGVDFKIYLHSRPAELYLTADSLNGQLNLHVIYDSNMYEEGVVREWLDEVKGAVLWYLGQTHRSCRAQRRGRSGDGKIGRGEGVQAKL